MTTDTFGQYTAFVLRTFARVAFAVAAILALGLAFGRCSEEPVHAQAKYPPPVGYVNDFAEVLTDAEEQAISEEVARLKASKNIELAVVTVRTTAPQDIRQYGVGMAREWGVGSKEGDKRGLLFLHAVGDRKTDVEVSRHLEGDFTDAATGVILRAARDDFRAARYGPGTLKVVAGLVARAEEVGAERKDVPSAASRAGLGWGAVAGIALFLLVVGGPILAVVLARRRRDRRAFDAERARVVGQEVRFRARSPRVRPDSAARDEDAPIVIRSRGEDGNPLTARARPRAAPKRESGGSRRGGGDDSFTSSALSSYGGSPSSSSSSSGSDSSSSSSSSDSGGGFGGGGDFGGGGASDSY